MAKEHYETEENQQNQPSDDINAEEQEKSRGMMSYIGWPVLIIIIVVGGYYGFQEWQYLESHVDTEDAQTTGHISPVLPRVSGYVSDVHVKDNELVHEGDPVVEIDSSEYVLQMQKAKSALQNARASLEVAKSSRQTAKVSMQKAQEDYNRDKDLLSGGAITQQEFDDTKAALTKAQSNYETAKKKVASVRTRITQQKNALDEAKLKLSYCKITAPTSGVVSKKNVQVGELIKPGQPIMSITDKSDVWVVANYKETQIKYIEIGQDVDVHVDAYPDKKFRGIVQSIAGGTGAKYSLLPPDNATGNFVKVVQRVPVKIVFNESKSALDSLQLGLNVEASININQHINTRKSAIKTP